MGNCCSTAASVPEFSHDRSRRLETMSPFEVMLEEEWDLMDKDKSGDLDLDELFLLMEHLNVQITRKTLKAKFEKFDVNKDGKLSKSEFRRFFIECQNKPGEEIERTFSKYSSGHVTLSLEGLARFLVEVQGQRGATVNDAATLLRRLRDDVRHAAAGEGTAADADATRAAEAAALAREVEAEDAAAGPAAAAAAPAAPAAGAAGPGRVNPLAVLGDSTSGAITAESTAAQREAAMRHLAERMRSEVSGMTLQEFSLLLTDPRFNSIAHTDRLTRVYQPMDRPLSHYFISSTHNTYLTGNQLNSPSSANAIRRVLSLGCRVVELDCYDDGDNEPIVTHGGTLTSKLRFREAVRAVREYAFRAENLRPSEYPVIITLENHCSPANQALQARILREELGPLLYVPPNPRRAVYPSPEELKGRVLIRDKPGTQLPTAADATTAAAATSMGDDEDDDEDDDAAAASAAAAAAADGEAAEGGGGAGAAGGGVDDVPVTDRTGDGLALESVAVVTAAGGAGGVEAGAGAKSEDKKADKKKKEKKKPMHPDLLALITVPNVKFKGLDKLEALGAGPTSSSFDETKMGKMADKAGNGPLFLSYTQKHLARVYPAGLRFDSSNYNPAPAWNAGAQLIALNYQTGDLPVFVAQSFFADNGGCGYVLKPSYMLQPVPPADFDPAATTDSPKLKLTVSVISGHYLPKPNRSERGEVIDPFVELRIVGAPKDASAHTTLHIVDNGFNPRWTARENNTATFTLRRPELAVLMLIVKDKDVGQDEFVAYAGFPVTAIRPGLRIVTLYDQHSIRLSAASLFVDVKVEPMGGGGASGGGGGAGGGGASGGAGGGGGGGRIVSTATIA